MLQVFRAAAMAILFCSLLLMVACHSDEETQKILAEKDALIWAKSVQIATLKTENEKLKHDISDVSMTPKCGIVACKNGTCYGIQRGDTLTGISLHFYGTAKRYDVLAALNGISNPDLIRVGACICITGSLKKTATKRETGVPVLNAERTVKERRPHVSARSGPSFSLQSDPLSEYLMPLSAPPVYPVSPLIDMPKPREKTEPLHLQIIPRDEKTPVPAKSPDSRIVPPPHFGSSASVAVLCASPGSVPPVSLQKTIRFCAPSPPAYLGGPFIKRCQCAVRSDNKRVRLLRLRPFFFIII